jgi:hypothetical protein
MFQMNPGALESEAQRRRELAFATMRAVHGTSGSDRRVTGVTRIRHVVVALAAIAAAQLA